MLELKREKANTVNSKRLRMEIKGLEKTIERLEEREEKLRYLIRNQ